VPPLGLLGIAFVGTFFWPVSPEAATVVWATHYGWHPALIGLVAATGQLAAHVVLVVSGDQIRRRWRWFDRQCERARLRFGRALSHSAPAGPARGASAAGDVLDEDRSLRGGGGHRAAGVNGDGDG
jgi:hypothetical protein